MGALLIIGGLFALSAWLLWRVTAVAFEVLSAEETQRRPGVIAKCVLAVVLCAVPALYLFVMVVSVLTALTAALP